jgi:hypothetical protein
MPNDPQRSRPLDWFMPFKPSHAAIERDEALASILHFQVNNTKIGETMHSIFVVVRKGDKAIARYIISHEDAVNGVCTGHGEDFAEYPIEEVNALVDEVRDHGLMIGSLVAQNQDPSKNYLEMAGPAFYMKIPEGITNTDILEKFKQDTQPEGETPKRVVTKVLGLNQDMPPVLSPFVQENGAVMEKEKNEALSATSNLERAAKEMELVKKYGKKQMDELAKKMNYQWASKKTIKTKTKSHAN